MSSFIEIRIGNRIDRIVKNKNGRYEQWTLAFDPFGAAYYTFLGFLTLSALQQLEATV